jgi:hypothetical protein
MSTPTYPKRLNEVVTSLVDYGWSFVVQHNKDTGDHPYIGIEARRDTQHVMITWHTRATGTYRIFTCMVNKRDTSLAKALAAVTA